MRRGVIAAATAVVIAFALTACTGDESAPVPTNAGPTVTQSSQAPVDVTPTPTPTGTPTPVSCETLISASLVKSYTDAGWTVRSTDLYIASDAPVPEGISCMWGDYAGPPSDNVAIFAWAPLSQSDAQATIALLVKNGWIREDGAEGTYVTIPQERATVTDENGYGATYLFSDDWVTFADTKQSLVLINRPER